MLQLERLASNASAALIKIGELNLLLPPSEVRSLESITDLDTSQPALHSIGWVVYMQKRWPVYCLSEDLTIMDVVPIERRACVILLMGAGYIGVLCNDLSMQKNIASQRYELPPAMRLSSSPILYLIEFEQGIACATSTLRLTDYLQKQVLNS
jgi:hypothetical protein